MVVCEGTEVLSSGRGADRDGPRTVRGAGTDRRARNGPGGPGPVEPELLSDPEEGVRDNGPVLDRGAGRGPARLQQAKTPPSQGGHPEVHGREHGAGAVPVPADPDH